MRITSRLMSRLSLDAVADCIDAAVAAPSIHNTQPWRFRVREREIEVVADSSRRLAVLDPTGRQMLMSVGAAVFNLRVAMIAHGRLPVQRLLPDRAQPGLIARVMPGPTTAPDVTASVLAAAIDRRHTNRFPFRTAAIPWPVIDDLIGAAAAEGAKLTVAEPIVRDAILALTRTADSRLCHRAAYRAELDAWTGGVPGRRDGVPPNAFGPRDAGHDLPLRDFGLDAPHLDPVAARFERRPTIVVLVTRGDTPYNWVRAGQALQRVLLTATARRLAVAPMNQALEIPELRRLVTDQSAGRYAQAILRIGYGEPVPPTPRRPLHEVVVADSGPTPLDAGATMRG